MSLFKVTCEGETHFSLFFLCHPLQVVGQDNFGIRIEQRRVVKGSEDIRNILALITGINAAGLYGNIGISKYPIDGKKTFFIDDNLPRGGVHEHQLMTP